MEFQLYQWTSYEMQFIPALLTSNYHSGTYNDYQDNDQNSSDSDDDNNSSDSDGTYYANDNGDSDSSSSDSDDDEDEDCYSSLVRLRDTRRRDNKYNTTESSNTILKSVEDNAQNGRVHRVEIASIAVSHNRLHCLGIQTTYRIIYDNGNVELCRTPTRAYNKEEENAWKYRLDVNYSSIEFEKGEYLAEIRTRQANGDNLRWSRAVTNQISFITNLRTVSFGGDGGIGEDMSAPPDLRREIIGLNGTFNLLGRERVLGVLGSVSISRNWKEVGPLVLLRSLIEKGRASPRSLSKMEYAIPRKRKFAGSDKSLKKDDTVLHEFVMDSHQDVFRRILSFLGYGMRV